MSSFLTDLNCDALALAVKANLVAFFRYLGRSPAAEFASRPPLDRWHTRMGHAWFDGVISRGDAPAKAPALITTTRDYFQSRGVSVFSWWLDPEQPAERWDAHLRAAGFGVEADTPGMAIALDAVADGAPAPAGLQIAPVEDAAALQAWTSTAAAGFGIPATSEQDFHDLMAGLGLDLPQRHYLGTLDGAPVATSSLFLAAGVAGVQFVSTRPEARGRGLAAAMTRAPLLDARRLGYRAGILQSSEMGYRVYERLGFKRVSDVTYYAWKRRAE